LQVSNLYPFESTIRSGKPFDVCVENIDIGGPTMIRAAAKNHAFVTVITSPSQFPDLLADMEANGGCTSLALRKRFAAEAFRVTAHYDSMIARWMTEQVPGMDEAPERASIPLNKEISLKYGCNPHQLPASVYSITGSPLPFEVCMHCSPPAALVTATERTRHISPLALPIRRFCMARRATSTCSMRSTRGENAPPLGGFRPLETALKQRCRCLVKELKSATGLPAAASFKHVSPTGAAVAVPLTAQERVTYDVDDSTLSAAALAYVRARQSDPMSAIYLPDHDRRISVHLN
jgi:phosphoribosylaminoimidazolecarboxamide formyltransferase / IMP cyclohydrolase